MAEEKKYYWIKLRDTFLTSDAVDFLMGQKNGSEYVVLYQMLCLKTANTGGEFVRTIGEVIIPYDAEKIQRDCKYFSIDTVHIALTLYKKLALIYEQENGVLKIANFNKLVGDETKWAKYKQEQRERERLEKEEQAKIGQCQTDVQPQSNESPTRYKRLDTRNKEIKISDKDISTILPDATSSTEPNIFEKIISYLNSKTNCNYKHKTKSTQQHINARIKDGFTFDDFKTVIDKKTKEWKGTEFEKFLRPETLFGTKFESYLNTKIIIKGEVKPRDDYTHQDYTPEQLNSVYVDINNVDLDNLEI